MAPISPFFADWLFRNLNEVSGNENHESVHLTYFPKADPKLVDKDLEERMSHAQRISSLVLSLRKKERLRVRQPLQKIMLPVLSAQFANQVKQVEDLILAEVNIKEIEYLTDASGVIKKKAKPNFKTLGKRLGANMKAAAGLINNLTDEDINRLETTGSHTIEVNGESIELGVDDFEISAQEIPGWQVAQDKEITVALDITLTDELKSEGLAKELINRIQGIRKDQLFEITDRINVQIEHHEQLVSPVSDFHDFIANEVLANEIKLVTDLSGDKTDLIDGLTVAIEVNKVNA